MSRVDDMATIDAALTGTSTQTISPTNQTADTALFEPAVAPGVSAPAPLTKATADKPAPKGQPRPAKTPDPNAQQRQIQQQEQQQAAQLSSLQTSATRTTQAVGSIFRGVGIRLGSIPAGSIVVPLAILLVFFLLLIPVNGHTRFVWLWMVLTGDAVIGQTAPDIATGDSTGTGTSAGASSGVTIQANLPTNTVSITAPANLFTGSYVEEVG